MKGGFTQHFRSFVIAIAWAIPHFSFAQEFLPDRIYTGDRTEEVSIDSVVNAVTPGTIFIVSEFHTLLTHHEKQVEILNRLSAANSSQSISVGLEFLQYPYQAAVDAFTADQLTEPDFLKAVAWRGDFNLYRRQVLFPRKSGGRTLALNAPAFLTAKVAKEGLSALSDSDRKFLPPDFALGNALYFDRFQEDMREHVPPEKIRNYFSAQSIWDDTMAFTATEYLKREPEKVLVIIVGDFHAIYGGGLPDRIRARGHDKLLVISQLNLYGLKPEEISGMMKPDPKWGPRADFIWTSSEKDAPRSNALPVLDLFRLDPFSPRKFH